jgi:hypothetical protein
LRAAAALVVVFGAAAPGLGCNASCDTSPDDNPPQVFAGGVASGTGPTAVYESSPPDNSILAFPAGKQYFLVHHLGFVPAFVQVEFGFDTNGDDFSPCSGNTCVIPCVNSEIIWLRNDTCADFLVRVSAMGVSNFQNGTVCPGGAAIAVNGASDASFDVMPPTTTEGGAPFAEAAAPDATTE